MFGPLGARFLRRRVAGWKVRAISYNAGLNIRAHREAHVATTRKAAPAAEQDAQANAVPQDFETALAELESLVAAMEDGGLPLEASLAAYKRGVALSRVCQDRLAQAEQQVKVLEGELLKPLDTSYLDDDAGL